MGILAAIDRALDGNRPKGNPPGYAGGTTTFAGPMYIDAFGAKRAPIGYELVEAYKSIVFACVQLNAVGVARTPLRLMVDSTKGGRPNDVARPRGISRGYYDRLMRTGYLSRTTASYQDVQEVTDHPLLDVLDNPDPEGYFSRQDLLGLMSAYCDVVGVGYLKVDGPQNAPPSYLWPLQAQYVTDLKKPGTPVVERYTYFGASYDPWELLRFRPPSLSLRDPYARGYSATYAALQYAQLEDKYVTMQDQILGKGPRPELLISAKDAMMPFGEAERQRYAQDLSRLHSRGHAGGPLIVNGAVDVKPLSYSPTDMSGMQLAEQDLERICNVFGVPVSYYTKDTNLANLQAAELQHARMAVEPRCQAIAGTLTRFVRQFDPRLFFCFDNAVEEDKEREARIIDMMLDKGRITINESLADTQWEPKEWGDEPWLPGTLQQPTMMKASHEQGLEMAEKGMENESLAVQAKAKGSSDEGDGGSGDAARSHGGGADGGAGDPGLSAVHAGSVDARFDAILTKVEESLGL